jgi:hypothetical protein
LLALLFIADACLPKWPATKLTTDAPPLAIRVSSESKWPERIIFDTSAPIPHVATAANSVTINPEAVNPARARDAFAQLQTSDQMQGTGQKKLDAQMQRQQRIAKRHVARPFLRASRQPRYAWFGGRMWW